MYEERYEGLDSDEKEQRWDNDTEICCSVQKMQQNFTKKVAEKVAEKTASLKTRCNFGGGAFELFPNAFFLAYLFAT